MHFIYKLIALSVVFGLVLAAPKVTDPSFDDLANEGSFVSNEPEVIVEDEGIRTVGVDIGVPALDNVLLAIKAINKLVDLKTKALALAVKAIKWIVSKSLFLAIGAIAAFAFCKLTHKCNLALAPAIYHEYVPAQVRDFVTPERLEDAQQFFISAMKNYAEDKNSDF